MVPDCGEILGGTKRHSEQEEPRTQNWKHEGKNEKNKVSQAVDLYGCGNKYSA